MGQHVGGSPIDSSGYGFGSGASSVLERLVRFADHGFGGRTVDGLERTGSHRLRVAKWGLLFVGQLLFA